MKKLSYALTATLIAAPAWAQDEGDPAAEPAAVESTSAVESAEAEETSGQEDTAPAKAETPQTSDTAESELEELKQETDRKIDVLAAELERLRLGDVAPVATQSVYGLGPAASKVYASPGGISIGGYGELVYQDDLGSSNDEFDFLRNIIYVGYKFDDKWVLNTEIEIEHVSEIFLEFAYLDYLWKPELNFRVGMLLIPMGLVNELHEPTVFLGALRPETEQRILPTTWRENGLGIFGTVGPFSYKAYAFNGMDASGYDAVGGTRGGRQKGAEALAEDFAGVVRLDYQGVDGLLLGGSVSYGGADQGQYGFDVNNLMFEGHVDYKIRGLQLRALYAGARIYGAGDLSQVFAADGDDAIGEYMHGWYVQAGYDVLSLLADVDMSMSPYFRYEQVNTQASMPDGFNRNPAGDREIITAGAEFKPFSQVVFKGEYQRFNNDAGVGRDNLNAVFGYIF